MVDESGLVNGKYRLFILIADYVGPREGFPDVVARKNGEYIPRCECVSDNLNAGYARQQVYLSLLE